MAQAPPVSLMLFPRKPPEKAHPTCVSRVSLRASVAQAKANHPSVSPIVSHLAYIYWHAFMALSSKANLSPESLLISLCFLSAVSLWIHSLTLYLVSSSALGLFLHPHSSRSIMLFIHVRPHPAHSQGVVKLLFFFFYPASWLCSASHFPSNPGRDLWLIINAQTIT